jgi:hypothetical protein
VREVLCRLVERGGKPLRLVDEPTRARQAASSRSSTSPRHQRWRSALRAADSEP